MLRLCDECDVAYDDLDHWTICPHEYFEKPADSLDKVWRMIAFTTWYTTWWGMTPKQYAQKELAESFANIDKDRAALTQQFAEEMK